MNCTIVRIDFILYFLIEILQNWKTPTEEMVRRKEEGSEPEPDCPSIMDWMMEEDPQEDSQEQPRSSP